MRSMFLACWSLKGGSGTTVVSAVLGLMAARTNPAGALLVDLAGDLPAAVGVPEPPGQGVAEWLRAGEAVPPDGWARLEVPLGPGLDLVPRGSGPLGPSDRAEVLAGMLAGDHRAVVVDCGTTGSADADADACALVLASMATVSLLVIRPCYLALRRAARSPLLPSGVVLLEEPGRALLAADVESIVGAPVVARITVEPAVARAVDAGLLGARLPRSLERALRDAA